MVSLVLFSLSSSSGTNQKHIEGIESNHHSPRMPSMSLFHWVLPVHAPLLFAPLLLLLDFVPSNWDTLSYIVYIVHYTTN